MRKILFSIVLIASLSTNVYALRILKPQTFSLPWTKPQINQLNETLESLWFIQNGRYELDVVTTTKSAENNGVLWIFNDGGIIKLQTRVGGTTYTWTQD